MNVKLAKKSYPGTPTLENSYEEIISFLAEHDYINQTIHILKNLGFNFKITLIDKKDIYFEFHHENLPTINSGLNIDIASSVELFEIMFKLACILYKKV